jgi:hypothetical protein
LPGDRFFDTYSFMVRSARRSRFLLAVAIALAGLMAAPLDACDDYACLNHQPSPARAGMPADALDDLNLSSDESPHPHVCCCIVCELTTDDSFAPRLPSPRRGETLPQSPAVAVSSTYLPDIFRPPIA